MPLILMSFAFQVVNYLRQGIKNVCFLSVYCSILHRYCMKRIKLKKNNKIEYKDNKKNKAKEKLMSYPLI